MTAAATRFVWVFVFFDLPVGTKADRRAASKFRLFLKDDGFLMLQFSVYARICRGEDGAEVHIRRVERAAGKGQCSCLAGDRSTVWADEADAGNDEQDRACRAATDGSAVISILAKG